MADRNALAASRAPARSRNAVKLVLAWGFVGMPLAWGVIQTLINAVKAFH